MEGEVGRMGSSGRIEKEDIVPSIDRRTTRAQQRGYQKVGLI